MIKYKILRIISKRQNNEKKNWNKWEDKKENKPNKIGKKENKILIN